MAQTDPTSLIFDAADRLARLGISVIPIAAGTKEPPPGFRWGEFAKRIADVSERHNWFVEHDHQLAVVAGPVSGHLVPLDYDGANGFAVHAAEYPILSTYPRVLTGSGKHHVWVRTAGPVKKSVTRLCDGSRLEVRAGTHYTLCPPSRHPSGGTYTWDVAPWRGIPLVDLGTLGLCAEPPTETIAGKPADVGPPLTEDERATIVRLVQPAYVGGQKHDTALALAGWLVNLSVPENDATIILDALAEVGDDLRQLRRAIRDTYRKAGEGIAVAGWARLVDTRDPLVTPAIAKQLDLLLRSRLPQFDLRSPVEAPVVVPEPSGRPVGPGITGRELQHKQFKPLRWIVEDMVPEGALLIAGKPKSKKSWLALGIALAVSMNGRALGSLPVIAGRVLYLDLEGNQRRIQSRIRTILGASAQPWPDDLHIFTAGEWPSGHDALPALVQWFDDYPDTVLVIVDVLQDFRPPMDRKENPYDYDRNTLKVVNQLAEQRNAAILLIHHTRKAKGEDAFDEISGTLGISSAVATNWVLSRGEDGKHTILTPNGRDLRHDEPLALLWDPLACLHTVDGTADQARLSRERQAILHFLSDDQAHSPKEIAMAVGKSIDTTQHLLLEMLHAGQIDRASYGKYARVPIK